MTLGSTVRVTWGRYRNKIGTVQAICENSEYLVDFSDGKSDVIKGVWINKMDLEQIG